MPPLRAIYLSELPTRTAEGPTDPYAENLDLAGLDGDQGESPGSC